jgi:hypothetical protein
VTFKDYGEEEDKKMMMIVVVPYLNKVTIVLDVVHCLG